MKGKGFVANTIFLPILVISLISIAFCIVGLVLNKSHTTVATVTNTPDCATTSGQCLNTAINFITSSGATIDYVVPSFTTKNTLASGATLNILYDFNVAPMEMENSVFISIITITLGVSVGLAIISIIMMYATRGGSTLQK